MCGIIGGFTTNSSFDKKRANEGLSVIAHRGPDGSGTFFSNHIFLGHQRLAILDPRPEANQPFVKNDHVLAFNGEVYNHLQLRQLLSQRSFDTSSDTETVINGFIEKGEKFLDECRGMYAGAIFNTTSQRLTLFRDRLGIKPIYYLQQSGNLFFASEIKGILKLLQDPISIDQHTIHNYLAFENYEQGPSFFNGVKMLKPGEIVHVELEGNELKIKSRDSRKARLSSRKDLSFDGCVRAGRAIIESSVQSHLLSDVPLATYLSGGIDSSLVTTLASRERSDIVGFVGYFEGVDSYYDERAAAREVARACKIQLNEVKITPNDFIDCFDKVIYHLDEPRMGMGSFSQFVVAREVAKHRKVVLTGHGGDELFAGYPLFKALSVLEKSSSPFKGLAEARNFGRKELPWFINSWLQLSTKGRLVFPPIIHKSSVEMGSSEVFCGSDPKRLVADLAVYYQDAYLPGLLVVEDKISMAHGLESRLPLWSDELVEWAGHVSNKHKLKNGKLKTLLKEIARPYLPEVILTGPKRGFPTPLRLWFRGPLREFVNERLLNPCPLLDDYTPLKIRQSIVSSRVGRFSFAADELNAHRIWTLLCVQSWFKNFRENLNVG